MANSIKHKGPDVRKSSTKSPSLKTILGIQIIARNIPESISLKLIEITVAENALLDLLVKIDFIIDRTLSKLQLK